MVVVVETGLIETLHPSGTATSLKNTVKKNLAAEMTLHLKTKASLHLNPKKLLERSGLDAIGELETTGAIKPIGRRHCPNGRR